MCPVRALIRPDRCRSWISTTRCVSRCPRPEGAAARRWGTFDIGHPDVLEFIRSKRENGRLRQFNLSLLVTDEFIKAVKTDGEWKLAFPLGKKEFDAEQPDLDDESKYVWREWPYTDGYVANEEGLGRLQDLQDAAGAARLGRHQCPRPTILRNPVSF